MWTVLEKLKVNLSVRLVWRLSGRQAEAIRGFQATEADGVWHLQRAIPQVSDPKMKAIIFTHSLEEESHADEFVSVYKQYGNSVFSAPQFERQDLYDAETPVWKRFAFVHVGEVDATERFRMIQHALGPGPLKSSLGKVVDDEDGHVDLTHAMLKRMGAQDREIRTEYFKVRVKRAWEQWLRVGKRVVDTLATLLLSVTYFVVGPFVARAARNRLQQRVVTYDNSHLKRV